MLPVFRTFCRDERGTLFATEWAFVATILVLSACSWAATRQLVTRAHAVAAPHTLNR